MNFCYLSGTRGHLNIKMLSYQYRDPHVKVKTVSPTVLSLTWESPYLGKTVFTLRQGSDDVIQNGWWNLQQWSVKHHTVVWEQSVASAQTLHLTAAKRWQESYVEFHLLGVWNILIMLIRKNNMSSWTKQFHIYDVLISHGRCSWKFTCIILKPILIIDIQSILYEINLKWIPVIFISQYWFRLWLGAIRQNAMIWANVDQVLQCHMLSLGLGELMYNFQDPWRVRKLRNKFVVLVVFSTMFSWITCYDIRGAFY